MAQHGSLREGICAQRAAAIRPAKMASAMGRGGACPRPTVEVPSIWGASEIREHARACIGSKAKAHMCSDRIALLAYMPKGRDADLGARAPCETLCETNECTSAKHCRRSRAGTLVLDEYDEVFTAIHMEDGHGSYPGPHAW